MRRWNNFWIAVIVIWFSAGSAITTGESQAAPASDSVHASTVEGHADELLRIRLREGLRTISIESGAVLSILSNSHRTELGAGKWRLQLDSAAPARERHHLFVKGFKPKEFSELSAVLELWRERGYDPVPVPLGHQLRLETGGLVDARVTWISLARFDDAADAEAKRKQLESQQTWAWQRAELTQAGTGRGKFIRAGGSQPGEAIDVSFPLTLTSSQPVTLEKSGDYETRQYAGALEIGIGTDGLLHITELIGIDDYLACVLPEEMPALWPVDALESQAVAARSDVLEHMRVKHVLSGFHFTDTVRDRMYKGSASRHAATDLAVAKTHGEVLTDGTRLIPGVFSATCGGWTENNETAWSAPVDAALRGGSDLHRGAGAPSADIRNWLTAKPAAFCEGDAKSFRWTRKLSREELTQLVNKQHKVGTVQRIELGDRGVSGRLKWVKVHGSAGSVTINKELPIRQAFGGLPSALFIIDGPHQQAGQVGYTFIGGGRGHGVGLCQNGAKGMAAAGHDYKAILAHYFAGASVVRVR